MAKESGGAGKAVGVVRTVDPREVPRMIRQVLRGELPLVLPRPRVLVALGTRGV